MKADKRLRVAVWIGRVGIYLAAGGMLIHALRLADTLLGSGGGDVVIPPLGIVLIAAGFLLLAISRWYYRRTAKAVRPKVLDCRHCDCGRDEREPRP